MEARPPYLSDLRVVELAGNPGSAFCAKLFASFGAAVTKVVTPGEPAATNSIDRAAAVFLDCDKTPRPVDGDREAAALLADADVVVCGRVPPALSGVLSPAGCSTNARAVLALVTDYGFDGPYAGWKATALTGLAAGGYLYGAGDPGRPPLRGPEFQPYFHAGLHAFEAAMAALLERRRSGLGQRVSASVMQSLAAIHEWDVTRYTHAGIVQRRAGNRTALYHPYALFPCKDGYLCICAHDEERSNLLLAAGGHPEFIDDPRFVGDVARGINQAEYDACFVPWMMETPTEELLDEFERLRIVAGRVRSVPEVLADPFMADQGYWQSVEFGGRMLRLPELVGRATEFAHGADGARPATDEYPASGSGPLAGLRVLDLTRHWAGPIGVRPLGDLGADVIRVEAPWLRGTEPPDEQFVRVSGFYMDNDPGERYWTRTGMFNEYNYNKKCVALRIDEPEGREVFERLLASADVIIDNYATHTCEAFGITPEGLQRINPAIVSVSMSGFGRAGPFRNRGAFGPASEAFAGVASMVGYVGEGPHLCAPSFPDPGAGMFASSHALVGLWWRERAGHGIYFDSEQVRAVLSFIGPEVTRYELTGEETPRLGAGSERFVPQGAYPCRGEDRWLALSVTSDEEWQALTTVIGRDALATAQVRLDGRRAAPDEIDAAIAAWTSTRARSEAANELQAAGIPAFPAFDARDIAEEPYLWDTGVVHRVAGEPLLGFLFQLSRTPARLYRGVPDVGEHNVETLRGLGYSDADIAGLAERDIIVDRPKL